MPDLDQLNQLGADLLVPSYDDVVRAAGRRRRRVVALTAGAATLAIVAGVTVFMAGDGERTSPAPVVTPTPSPTPSREEQFRPESMTSMTPREVVMAEHAELQWAGTSYDDPDVRVALWAAECRWCPKKHPELRSRPSFQALALTTSGFRSEIVYHRAPWGQGLPVTVESPAPDVFLLAHDNGEAGPGWLLDLEGVLRRVRWTETPIEPAEPRQWFRCTSRSNDGATWCTVDPKTATAYEWPGWSVYGGATGNRPDAGELPWGAGEGPDGYAAFWQEDGTTRWRALPPAGGRVHNPPESGPLFFAANTDRVGTLPRTLDLLYVDGPGDTWRRVPRDAPELDRTFSLWTTPDSGLLAVQSVHGLEIWRADGLLEGDFVPVFTAGPGATREANIDPEPRTVDGRIFLQHGGLSLVSDDDGRTWSTTSTWRVDPSLR